MRHSKDTLEWYRSHKPHRLVVEPAPRLVRDEKGELSPAPYPWTPPTDENCPHCKSEFFAFTNTIWTSSNECLTCGYQEYYE